MGSRQYLGLRISDTGKTWLDTLAENETARTGLNVTRSDVVRASLAVAKRHEKEVQTAITTIVTMKESI